MGYLLNGISMLESAESSSAVLTSEQIKTTFHEKKKEQIAKDAMGNVRAFTDRQKELKASADQTFQDAVEGYFRDFTVSTLSKSAKETGKFSDVDQLKQKIKDGDPEAIAEFQQFLEESRNTSQHDVEAKSREVQLVLEQVTEAKQQRKPDRIENLNEVILSELPKGTYGIHRALYPEYGSLFREDIILQVSEKKVEAVIEKVAADANEPFPLTQAEFSTFIEEHKSEINQLLQVLYSEQFGESIESMRRRDNSMNEEVSAVQAQLRESVSSIAELQRVQPVVEQLAQDEKELYRLLEEIKTGQSYRPTLGEMIPIAEGLPKAENILSYVDRVRSAKSGANEAIESFSYQLRNDTINAYTAEQVYDQLRAYEQVALDTDGLGNISSAITEEVFRDYPTIEVGWLIRSLDNWLYSVRGGNIPDETSSVIANLRNFSDTELITPTGTIESVQKIDNIVTSSNENRSILNTLRTNVEGNLRALTFNSARTDLFTALMQQIAENTSGIYSYAELKPASFIQDRLSDLFETNLDTIGESTTQLLQFLQVAEDQLPKITAYLNQREEVYQNIQKNFDRKYGPESGYDFIEEIEWKNIQAARVPLLEQSLQAKREELSKQIQIQNEVEGYKNRFGRVEEVRKQVSNLPERQKTEYDERVRSLPEPEAKDEHIVSAHQLEQVIQQAVERHLLEAQKAGREVNEEELLEEIDKVVEYYANRAKGITAINQSESPKQLTEQEAEEAVKDFSKTYDTEVARESTSEHVEELNQKFDELNLAERVADLEIMQELASAETLDELYAASAKLNKDVESVKAVSGSVLELYEPIFGQEVDAAIIAQEPYKTLYGHFRELQNAQSLLDQIPQQANKRAAYLTELFTNIEQSSTLFDVERAVDINREGLVEYEEALKTRHRRPARISIVTEMNVIIDAIDIAGPLWQARATHRQSNEYVWSRLPKALADKLQQVIPEYIDRAKKEKQTQYDQLVGDPPDDLSVFRNKLKLLGWLPVGMSTAAQVEASIPSLFENLNYGSIDEFDKYILSKNFPNDAKLIRALEKYLKRSNAYTYLVRIQQRQIGSLDELHDVLVNQVKDKYKIGNFYAYDVAVVLERLMRDWENVSQMDTRNFFGMAGKRKKTREEFKALIAEKRIPVQGDKFGMMNLLIDLLVQYDPAEKMERQMEQRERSAEAYPYAYENLRGDEVIGRGEDNPTPPEIDLGRDMRIDGKAGLSRQHAKLSKKGNDYYLMDLREPYRIRELGATKLNDLPLESKKMTKLESGMSIKLGLKVEGVVIIKDKKLTLRFRKV